MELTIDARLAVPAMAALQLLLAHRRDLGPLSVIAAGMSATLLPEPATGALIAISALISALAWARSARASVGQPELVAIAMAIAVLGPSLAPLLEPYADDARSALVIAQGALGCILTAATLRRASSRRVRVRWVGEIPVERV